MQASRSMRAQQQRTGSGAASATAAPRRRVLGLGSSHQRSPLVVRASTVLPTPNFSSSSEESGFSPSLSVPSTTMGSSVPHITMSGGMGSQSGLGATMERSRMNFVMPTPVVKGPKLDDGGDGGDIGKNNRNGGGGDGGGGDDDDWFGEEDGDGEGEGGDAQRGPGFFRAAVLESYDKLSLGAVFAEWMKTIQDLPAILRQAVQMGLFSSAQLVRFFSMDVRPGLTRSISRHLPPSAARDFVGRLMADPGFVQKMVLEAAFASCASLWYEFRARGDRFKDELDLALINTIGMAAATGATVWLLAPCRSYGSLQKMPWQQMLEGLPNCVFDVSGPLRSYTKGARAAGFLAKAAELSAVGALTGTATALLASAAVAVRQRADPEWQPSVPVPSVGRSSGGLAAFFALNANVRYQLIGGLDRFLFDRTTFLWTYVVGSGAARLASNQVGEVSRAWWQGLPDPRSLPAPAFLSGPALPITRRVRKKVSKRVPRSVLQQQQQAQQLQAQQPATMAVVGTAVGAAATLELLPLLLEPLSAAQQQYPEGVSEGPQEVLLSSSSAAAAAVALAPQRAVAAEAEVAQSAAAAATAVAQEPQVVQMRAVAQQQEASAVGQGPAAAAAAVQQSEDDDDEEDDEESSGGVSSEEAPALQPQRRGAYAARH